MMLDSQEVSTDFVLKTLTDRRRRSILIHLIDSQENVAHLETLVNHIRPENPPPDPADPNRHDQLTLELRHVHLPMLADAGIVEYDDRTGVVRYYPNERVEKLLQFVTVELE